MLIYIATLLLLGPAQAQTTIKVPVPESVTAPAGKKSSTKLFEEDPEPTKDRNTKFSAKVKVVREESDGVEVFFEGEKQKGAYYLYRSVDQYGTLLKTLETSKKPQGHLVEVSVDPDRRIKSVQKVEASKKGSASDWDFNNVPD